MDLVSHLLWKCGLWIVMPRKSPVKPEHTGGSSDPASPPDTCMPHRPHPRVPIRRVCTSQAISTCYPTTRVCLSGRIHVSTLGTCVLHRPCICHCQARVCLTGRVHLSPPRVRLSASPPPAPVAFRHRQQRPADRLASGLHEERGQSAAPTVPTRSPQRPHTPAAPLHYVCPQSQVGRL